MWISQINPDWVWEKWESSVVKGGQVTKYARTVKYFPQYEVPDLQKTLGARFAELVNGVVSEESFISSWLNDFGPLSNTGLQLFRIDELLEEARHVWWVLQVLDVFKRNGLDPESINLIEAERCLLPVPNPLQGLSDLEEGVIAAKYKNAEKLVKSFSHFQGQGQYEWPVLRLASRSVSSAETEWSASYSMLLDNVVATINHYLALNTFIQNQNPQDFPRDVFGRKKSSDDFPYEAVKHKIATVIQPRNLSGYIWLRLQEEFEATPTFSSRKESD